MPRPRGTPTSASTEESSTVRDERRHAELQHGRQQPAGHGAAQPGGWLTTVRALHLRDFNLCANVLVCCVF